jgi:hypothetical protein
MRSGGMRSGGAGWQAGYTAAMAEMRWLGAGMGHTPCAAQHSTPQPHQAPLPSPPPSAGRRRAAGPAESTQPLQQQGGQAGRTKAKAGRAGRVSRPQGAVGQAAVGEQCSGQPRQQRNIMGLAVRASRCQAAATGPTCQPPHVQRLVYLLPTARGRGHSPPQPPGAVAAAAHVAVATCKAQERKRGTGAGPAVSLGVELAV